MTTYSAGDFILCKSNHWIDRLIRFGQRLRDDGPGSAYDHAALVIDDTGTIIEAVSKGLSYGHVTDYPNHLLFRLTLDEPDGAKAVSFAHYWLDRHVEYGYLEDLSIGLDLLTPRFIHFKSAETMICSEFVARALAQTGWVCPKLDVSHVRPDDLFKWFAASVTPTA